MTAAIRSLITEPVAMAGWGLLVIMSLAVLIRDLRENNAGLSPLMRWVWGFTVAYSGPVGLAVYWGSGRAQIPRDTLWRRALRSDAHCYSGCGAGEIVGVVIAVGLLALGNLWVAAITFTLAYTFGLALTAGPLMQEGVPRPRAWRDAFISESASIVVMEAVAISVDLWLAGEAGIGDALFWSSLAVSLTLGFWAAYPVNALLVHLGVKEGMHDPRETADAGAA